MIFAVALAVGLGCAVRAFHVLSADFPLNDGGLFYVMVQELQRAGYRLPDFTSYNASAIAFAYPPLGFYIAGVLAQITPLTLIDIFRFLPLFISTLAIVAFAFLASSMLRKTETVIAAVFAFALIPRSFIWLVMGGGVTRSLGFLFAILALYFVHRLYTMRDARYVTGTTLCAGLTALSHIGTVPFLAFSMAVLFLFYGWHRHAVISSCAIAVGTLVITSPWWVTIIAVHGVEPFRAAAATGGSVFSDSEARRAVLGLLARLGVGSSTGGSTAEPLFPLLGTMAFLGALYSVVFKKWQLVAWWLATILLDVRAGSTYATVPIAMLAGIGIMEVLYRVLHIRDALHDENKQAAVRPNPVCLMSGTPRATYFPRQVLASIILIFLLAYAAGSSVSKHPALISDLNYLVALSGQERGAMLSAGSVTDPSSRFLVLPESQWYPWTADKTSEWFPALTGKVSVATVQGTEWLPSGAFNQARQNWKSLKACQSATSKCLEEWSKTTGIEFTHVYVPQPPRLTVDTGLCCEILIASLREDPRYHLLIDQPGGILFARR
jgi:hypothetical protein